ncbi:hypothetical protein ACF3N0_00240 [Moraxella atlantae]
MKEDEYKVVNNIKDNDILIGIFEKLSDCIKLENNTENTITIH